MTDTGTAAPQSFAQFFAAEVVPRLPSLGAARHAEDDLRRLAEAFTVPHRLIDNLHGERKPLLPGK